MPRCFVVIDRVGRLDLRAALESACAAMTRGGSRERRIDVIRPPFAAVVLTLQPGHPIRERDEGIDLDLGAWPEPDAARALEGPAPGSSGSSAAPDRPWGRRAMLSWCGRRGELRVLTEANGQLPLYALHSSECSMVASETKAIHAAHPRRLETDVDGLLELHQVGHLIAGRTLFRDVRCLPPGALVSLGPGAPGVESAPPLRFSDHRGNGVAASAEALNRSLIEVLRVYRRAAPRMTVALSGGMDSRHVLAAAQPLWSDLDAITFGEPGSTDVALAREIARRARLPHRHLAPAPSFLSEWAGYATWRSDGMLSCLHAHGMDAVIAASDESRQVLNGMGGDLLMGAFLRLGHLALPGDPERAARFVIRSTRPGPEPLEAIFRPGVLERAATRPDATLVETMRSYPHARLGNVLLGYWLRHRCARLTALGVGLESPFVEHWTPLVDPHFVRAATGLSLEARFMSRAQRLALARLAPALTRVRWERLGMAPGWPWPVLAMAKLVRRLGLRPRARPAVDYPERLRTTLRPWIEGLLLDPGTLADGWFRPEYLRGLLRQHQEGADRTSAIGMAATLELGRRLFVEGDVARAAPPAR